ncbi:MAG: sulfite exporter TauE/SafE family protein [Bacteroidales bacterium]|nr:sulfite exporter TauE/SafE family protein [Bacteroidales bacterium]
MEYIQSLLENNSFPVVVAFLLGLLTAISPCPLATNIAAIGFISKDIENKNRIFWNGLTYTLGRTISYTILGIILIIILRQGANVFHIQKAITHYGEMFLAPVLILIGLFMLFGHKLKLKGFGYKGEGKRLKGKGGWGALLLGMLFAMAFCPTSAVFYFGMLIPMSVTSNGGFFMPVIFSVATALPVIIVAWLLSYSVANLGKFYSRIQVFEKWVRYIVAVLFIIVGIYYGVIFYF